MIKISEIFSKEELDYLSKYKPGLAPMDVPSRSDANLLTKPSVDQIVIEFLKQYEVNVEPRSVGGWNGWDTVSTISSIFAKEGSTLNIASTMFYANRSNQINSAAQDWGTWKRWALDHKNFDEYKEGVLQLVDINNQRVIKELDEQIERAEANNKIISEALLEPSAKEYIGEAIRRNKEKADKQNTTLGCLILCIPFVIIFFVMLDQLGGGPEKREKNRAETLVSEAKQLVETASVNRRNASYAFQRIIEELPESYYEVESSNGWFIFNYFINEVNIQMTGQYGDISDWCQPQVIFNNSIKSRLKLTPMTQRILSDESYWLQEIRDMCSNAFSLSNQRYPNSIRQYYYLDLWQDN